MGLVGYGPALFTEKHEVRRHVGGKVERKEEGAEGATNGGIVGLESICAFFMSCPKL